MKASLLRSLYIILSSVCLTAYTLLASVVLSITGRLNRNKTNYLIQRWAQWLLNIPCIRREVVYETPLKIIPNRPYIVMCNHASLYDIPIALNALPSLSIRMLAKRELSRIPLFGFSLRLNEFVFINRHNRVQALKDLEKAKQLLSSGIVLWVAPEGTRSSNGLLLPFKKGVFHLALETQAIIIPITIRNAAMVLPPKTLKFHLNQSVSVRIGKAIDSSEYAPTERDQLMLAVRTSMEKQLSQSKRER